MGASRGSFMLGIAASAVVLLGLYIGAYFSTVIPIESVDVGTSVDPIYLSRFANHESSHRFFNPIHWVDRRVRPHVWDPDSVRSRL